jgi:predicted RNA-binding Zn-ribbon protein involved in translation (DUF1610 family)
VRDMTSNLPPGYIEPDGESAVPMCPNKQCESHDVERLDDRGDSEWFQCNACGWEGSEPIWIDPPSYEPEPDMSDFI